MSLNNPSDEVQVVMEMMRIRQKEAELKASEDQRIWEEIMRIWQKKEDEKVHQLLIEAEATILLEIYNYDATMIENIKNIIKQYPNMHVIELCEIFMGKIHNNEVADKFMNINPDVKHRYRISRSIPPYLDDVYMDKYEVLIYNKQKEMYDRFILKCAREVKEQIANLK
jgi:hypothetical protein